jgi:hypothetical protein
MRKEGNVKMKCYICGKGMDEGLSLVPIEPKGTLNRKWACLDHAEKIEVPNDIKEICSIFDTKFNELEN